MKDALEHAVDRAWAIDDQGYDPLGERGIESRFAVANGFIGVRGVPTIEEGPMWISWPRSYVAGLFATPDIPPRVPALVSVPDWVGVTILLNGEQLTRSKDDLAAHRRTLDMQRGVLLTKWRSSCIGGATLQISSLRLVSLDERGLGFQRLLIEVDGPAEISLEALCVASDPGLHPARLESDVGVWRTGPGGKILAMATAVSLQIGERDLDPVIHENLRWCWRWNSAARQTIRFERWVGFARGDDATDDPALVARAVLARAKARGTPEIVRRHEDAWDQRWRFSGVELEGDDAAQQALRFAVYHLNSAVNPEDDRVSVGARALTGDDYRGHVFWDTEIFLAPFYTLTWPAAARAILMYRYHALDGARAKATKMGWRGAFYAWESAGSGRETTPEQVIGADGTVVEILSGREEEHISADVAYAVCRYWWATGDDVFLVDAGAEILLETARFWASRAQLEADGRRHIRDVEGPDEYHEHIDDNAYTNVMARWNIRRALDVSALLRQRWPQRWAHLSAALSLDDTELGAWREVADTLAIGLDARTGLFDQFAGFLKLEDIDLSQYEGRPASMDVVLGHERIQRTQVVKQADVVALLALLPEEFNRQNGFANFRYYEPRCDHSSSLSPAMHAMVAARLGETDLALRYFRQAASIDLGDPASRSAGGVHIAAMGGLWQAAVFGFGGLSVLEDALAFDPRLPVGWTSLGFRIQWRGRCVKILIDQVAQTLSATLEAGEPMKIIVAGHAHELAHDMTFRISERDGAPGSRGAERHA